MGGVAWTEEEDELLRKCVQQYGEGKWHRVPSLAGLNRCRKSCRLRWLNYLRPNINRGSFGDDEVDLIIKLHNLLGNRWSLIAGRLPGRTANDVKNYWNCHLSKRLLNSQDAADLQISAVSPYPMKSSGASSSSNHSGQIQAAGGQFREEVSSTSSVPRMLYGQEEEAVVEGIEIDNCNYQVEQELLDGLFDAGAGIIGLPPPDFQFQPLSCRSQWDWDDLIGDMDVWADDSFFL